MSPALKEWDVAINALAEGETIMLLRKGGIREVNGTFEVPHRDVWLYPTYEHQKPNLLKPEYAKQIQPVDSGWHPESVMIRARATITHVIEVTEPEVVDALVPFHIWTSDFATERFRWKPRSPLYILLLRVYRLPNIITIPFDDAYRGCKSWMTLMLPQDAQPLDTALNAEPVLTDAEYQTQVNAIQQIIYSDVMVEAPDMSR